MLGINLDTVSLDAEQFKDAPGTYALALVVRDEAEAQRASDRANGVQRAEALTLRQLVIDPASLERWASRKPWYEYLAAFSVLERCAGKLDLSLPETIERIAKEIHPPNWQTLYWMHAYLKAIHDHKTDLAGVADEFEQQVQAEAARVASQALSASAKKAAGVRHKENRDLKAEAVAWYVKHRDTMSKNKAAERIAAEVVPVTVRTVRDWLIGV